MYNLIFENLGETCTHIVRFRLHYFFNTVFIFEFFLYVLQKGKSQLTLESTDSHTHIQDSIIFDDIKFITV